MSDPKNKLYYGDNLEVLRDYIPDQSVDLIYLDPPFNSRQDYIIYAGSAQAFSRGKRAAQFRTPTPQETASLTFANCGDEEYRDHNFSVA